MEKEVFPVIIDCKQYNIISTFPYRPNPDDHQVWNGDELLFIINPHLNEAGDPYGTLGGEYLYKNFDQEFVKKKMTKQLKNIICKFFSKLKTTQKFMCNYMGHTKEQFEANSMKYRFLKANGNYSLLKLLKQTDSLYKLNNTIFIKQVIEEEQYLSQQKNFLREKEKRGKDA